MKKWFTLTLALVIGPAQAATKNGFEPEFYGFVKASASYSSKALASYNNINLSAPTHAVPETRSVDKTSRLSFQGQQSRMGVNLKKGDALSTRIEFDFIDFSKSSPTTQMNPRVRIASVTYAMENGQKIIIGQDWDLFSPVTSFTYDIVGLYFMAGNTGFMRQQAQYLKTAGQWEFGAALGMAGNNPATADTDLELSKAPTYAGRVSYALENGRTGLSFIYSRLNYASTNGSTHDSYGANAFYERTGNLSVKSEAYYGQNMANIGTLALGKGTSTTDVKEYGATLTFQHKFSDKSFPFFGVGMARVDNPSQITPFSLSATNIITNPGVKQNILARLGWEYRITDDFSWFAEASRYQTTSKIAAGKNQLNIVGALESGVQVRF